MPTPHQRAEAELIALGLSFPETATGPAWPPTRGLYVRKKMFTVFGAKAEPLNALTILMKLPISAEMAEELPFVRPAQGWYKQHQWVTAHFGAEDDVLAEMTTLRGWLKLHRGRAEDFGPDGGLTPRAHHMCALGEPVMHDTFKLGDRTVKRLGYGAMQLAGPGVFGPPKDRAAAVAVLRAVIEAGVNHIDTSDYYGPYVTNEIIREALHPYPDDLVIVTKVGGKRDDKGGWLAAQSPDELKRGVEDNLKRLGLDMMEVVNLRIIGAVHAPSEGSIARQVETMAQLKAQGLLRHIGLSNVTATQVAEARGITEIVCVQNQYNLVHRSDDALVDALAGDGIAYVPFFPLGGFSPIQSGALSALARRLDATPLQVALAWLLHRAPNILLIPGTSSIAHLRENLAAADLELSATTLEELDAIGRA